jgi:hypothetical protein
MWNSSDRQVRGGKHFDECWQIQEQAAPSGTGTTEMEVTEITLAKVLRFFQLLSHSREFQVQVKN